jgi:hypothetical protein
VGHVDDPHQPEDQRETAGHDEEQRRERQPVERHDGEAARIVGALEKQPPDHGGDGGGDDDALGRPRRPALVQRLDVAAAFGLRGVHERPLVPRSAYRLRHGLTTIEN